ncbi:sigma-70 family RNA polymerase sigma factor, partial [Bacteroides acidifaciens]
IQAQENVYQTLLDKGQRELEIRISTLEACDPNEILSEELRAKVKTLLASMPEKTRIAFVRDRLDGKSHKEIAEELGISVKGVEYHITRAVKMLRDSLKDYAPFLFFFI